jgi:hypothetical protein
MPDPQVHLTAADAIELAEMLTLIGQWLGGDDQDQLAASFARFVGAGGYGLAGLRTDLARFSFVLGNDDASSSSAPRNPPADQDRRGSRATARSVQSWECWSPTCTTSSTSPPTPRAQHAGWPST